MLNIVSHLFCPLCHLELGFLKLCVLLWLPINKSSQNLCSPCWNSILTSFNVALEFIRIDFDVVYGNLNPDFFFLCSLPSNRSQSVCLGSYAFSLLASWR